MSRKSKRRKPQKPSLKGGLGGGASPLIPEAVIPAGATIDERKPRHDIKTVQAAVSGGWQIRPEAMSALPDSMLRIALDSKTEVRARVNAARVIVSMHGQNEPPPANQVNVGLQVNAADAVKAALNEPDYIRFCHARRSDQPSDVRVNGDSGTVSPAPSRNGDRGGNNGHSHGTNGYHAAN